MEKELDHQKELQLLPPPPPHPPATTSSSRALPWFNHHRRSYHPSNGGDHRHHDHDHDHDHLHYHHANGGPSLDLKLSISLNPSEPSDFSCIEALKWQAKEQLRVAAIEKAYAERVRELTRREIELAHSEFARARAMWDKAREEVAKAERLRDSATTCMGEITCHSCRQKFRPN
ncbi:zinc finger protein SHOOT GRAVITROPISM 5-like [Amaranthus tricolor]|uniref:zinc finger protein SHOOT GRAVITROPISM 5-like n=1 Tax=Amaranthus tricolor TaxID=29722 RepID=UPI002585F17D|nr:zinc finger protein SHOOT GRAVITROPISM 5-like [Amaranthus tricolor]